MNTEDGLKAKYQAAGHARSCFSAALGYVHWKGSDLPALACRESFKFHYDQLPQMELAYVRASISTPLLEELLRE